MTKIAELDELAQAEALARTVRRDDGVEVDVLLARAGDRVGCYENTCPHMGIGLDGGTGRVRRKRDHVFCAAHFAAFDLATGECVWGPCQGRSLVPVPVAVEGGAVALLPDSRPTVKEGEERHG